MHHRSHDCVGQKGGTELVRFTPTKQALLLFALPFHTEDRGSPRVMAPRAEYLVRPPTQLGRGGCGEPARIPCSSLHSCKYKVVLGAEGLGQVLLLIWLRTHIDWV